MLLENLAYPEVEEYLQSERTILIPVGSVEQHSPYGLIGTDFIAAEGVAREVGERMGVIVAPTITYGVSPHHMEFKGTATLSPATLMNIIIDVTLSFIRHGFRRIFYINGHGGNRSAIETAMQEMKMRGAPGQLVLFSWYEGLKESAILEELFQGLEGRHATPSEVALTRLLRPDAFAGKETAAKEVATIDFYWPLTAREMRTVFPDGRMCSAPWLATADKGKKVMDEAVQLLMKKIEKATAIPLLE